MEDWLFNPLNASHTRPSSGEGGIWLAYLPSWVAISNPQKSMTYIQVSTYYLVRIERFFSYNYVELVVEVISLATRRLTHTTTISIGLSVDD